MKVRSFLLVVNSNVKESLVSSLGKGAGYYVSIRSK
ncbi:hypothetical protein A5881_001669 [Enterococcus termitis]|nr:hypothetical protein A5881_002007 [Enterococcus termitis]